MICAQSVSKVAREKNHLKEDQVLHSIIDKIVVFLKNPSALIKSYIIGFV